MKLAGPAFLAAFGGRFVNTHPALLPSFPGMHGAADAAGVRRQGHAAATLFLVDDGVDTGPIVAQAAVPVLDDDDVESLHERIKVAERAMLVDVVGRMVRDGWSVAAGRVTHPCSDHTARTCCAADPPRALISVYDKTGLEELARALADAGVADRLHRLDRRSIAAAGVAVTAVEDVTGFPECLDGRVKTLHPRVHAGILADRRTPTTRGSWTSSGSSRSTWSCQPVPVRRDRRVRRRRRTTSSSRSTSAGRRWCAPRPRTTRAWRSSSTRPTTRGAGRCSVGGFTWPQRRRAGGRAFAHTAAYDAAVAAWSAQELRADDAAGLAGLRRARRWSARGVAALRREPAPAGRALRATPTPRRASPRRTQLHGKEMSYNNYVDADAALRAAYDFAEPAVAIIKHANPCGIAVGADVADAHRKAHACDPVSAFGGVIAANRP